MPNFNFKCGHCNLEFEKFVRDRETKEHACLDCGEMAEKTISTFGFVFGSSKSPGPTGVDSLDSSIDKNVGRDAQQKWEIIKDRETQKRQVIREYGPVGLRRNMVTMEYEPMKEPELKRFQSLHSTYDKLYTENVQSRKEKGIGKFDKDDPISKIRAQSVKNSE